MNVLRSDSEKAKPRIREKIDKLKHLRADGEYYHFAKSKVLSIINFCESLELITEEEAKVYRSEVLRY